MADGARAERQLFRRQREGLVPGCHFKGVHFRQLPAVQQAISDLVLIVHGDFFLSPDSFHCAQNTASG
ncbi:hypothetical protein D3C85_1643010 [compost metagenome]